MAYLEGLDKLNKDYDKPENENSTDIRHSSFISPPGVCRAEDDVRSGVVDLYAASLRSGKYLGCLTVGCSYGGWVNAWFLSLKPDL